MQQRRAATGGGPGGQDAASVGPGAAGKSTVIDSACHGWCRRILPTASVVNETVRPVMLERMKTRCQRTRG